MTDQSATAAGVAARAASLTSHLASGGDGDAFFDAEEQPQQPPAPMRPVIQIANCSHCRKESLAEIAKCLVDKDLVPVCEHKFCVKCFHDLKLENRRDGTFLSGDGCPECNHHTKFHTVNNVVLPYENLPAAAFFKQVNRSKTGKITQEEIVGWLLSYFTLEAAEAERLVMENWDEWDSETRGGFKRHLLRMSAKDGTLDEKEFDAAAKYIAGMIKSATDGEDASRRRSRGLESEIEPAAKRRRTAEPQGATPDELQTSMQSSALLIMLREGDGSRWFNHYDETKGGKLGKGVVVTALAETMKLEAREARSVIDGIWHLVDTSNDGSVDRAEFKTIRDMILLNVTANST
jgi:hypothetical protein